MPRLLTAAISAAVLLLIFLLTLLTTSAQAAPGVLAYVANLASNTVSAIDTSSIPWSILLP